MKLSRRAPERLLRSKHAVNVELEDPVDEMVIPAELIPKVVENKQRYEERGRLTRGTPLVEVIKYLELCAALSLLLPDDPEIYAIPPSTQRMLHDINQEQKRTYFSTQDSPERMQLWTTLIAPHLIINPAYLRQIDAKSVRRQLPFLKEGLERALQDEQWKLVADMAFVITRLFPDQQAEVSAMLGADWDRIINQQDPAKLEQLWKFFLIDRQFRDRVDLSKLPLSSLRSDIIRSFKRVPPTEFFPRAVACKIVESENVFFDQQGRVRFTPPSRAPISQSAPLPPRLL